MSFELTNISVSLIHKQAVSEIIKCNTFTSNFGLILTHEQAVELVKTRIHSLKENGRIEFGGGAIDKIIKEFCDSPYISKQNYHETLHELIKIFYYYKNDTLDLINDDELIKFMKKAFDTTCQASLELLSGRELSNMSHNLRYGKPIEYKEED